MLMGLALGYFLALVSRGMHGRQPGFRNLVLWFSTEEANRALLTAFAIPIMALSLVLTMSRSGIMSFAVALVMVATVMVRRQSGASRRALALPAQFMAIECKTSERVDTGALTGIRKLAEEYGAAAVVAARVVCRTVTPYPVGTDVTQQAVPLSAVTNFASGPNDAPARRR